MLAVNLISRCSAAVKTAVILASLKVLCALSLSPNSTFNNRLEHDFEFALITFSDTGNLVLS